MVSYCCGSRTLSETLEYLSESKERANKIRCELIEELRNISPEDYWNRMPSWSKEYEDVWNVIRQIEYAEMEIVCDNK